MHSAGFRESASTNTQFDAHIEAATARHCEPGSRRAIIQVESAFDRLAVSTAGARGLMQLMPATARRFGVTDCFDAGQNIFAGTRYLRILLDRYAGDVSLAAAAYNAGETAVSRYNGIPPYRETQTYGPSGQRPPRRRPERLGFRDAGDTRRAGRPARRPLPPGPGDQIRLRWTDV